MVVAVANPKSSKLFTTCDDHEHYHTILFLSMYLFLLPIMYDHAAFGDIFAADFGTAADRAQAQLSRGTDM